MCRGREETQSHTHGARVVQARVKVQNNFKEVGALLGAGLHLLVQEEFYISDT